MDIWRAVVKHIFKKEGGNLNNYSQVKSLIAAYSGQERHLTVPIIYIELTGDINTAVLLNQIIFWSDKTKRKDGFFYKTYSEWESEITLSQYQVSRSIKVLKDLGVVETKLKRANGSPTIHYRVDMEELSKSIINKLDNRKSTNLIMEDEVSRQSLTVDDTVDDSSRKNTSSNELTVSFESLWSLYPRKQGKQVAFKKYKQAIEKGTRHEEIEQGIKDYVEHIKSNNIKQNFVKHGSAWFNQAGWLDEYNMKKKHINAYSEEEINSLPF